MSNLKIAILDDDDFVMITLKSMLNKLGYRSIFTAFHFNEGLEILEKNKPDLFLLDINLFNEKNGIEFAKIINNKYHIPFIFITSDTNIKTIDNAIDTNPSGYLSKPIKQSDLLSAIKIALSQNNKHLIESSTLEIKHHSSTVQLNIDDIMFIKGEHVYIKVFIKNKMSYLIRDSLNNILTKLNKDFVRIHKSYIININFITQLNTKAVMIGKTQLPIGRNYSTNFKKEINQKK